MGPIVSANGEIVGRSGENHDADSGIESDKNRNLNNKVKDRAEGLNIIALVEIHHLDGFELAIAITALLNLGELGLNLTHHLLLVELTLHQGPH